MFAVGMFTMAQAQPGTRDNRQPDRRDNQPVDQQYDEKFDNRYDKEKETGFNNFSFDRDDYSRNSRFSNERKRDMQIAQVNQYFDYKIQRVKRSFYMSWFEKQRLIRSLEQQRQWEIRKVYAKFSNRNRFDNRYDRNGGYDRHDHSNGHF
jgi:hypothetical protein